MAEHQTANPDRQKPFNPPGVRKPFNHDEILAAECKDALLTGTESAGIEIQVECNDGIIRLKGVVDVLSHRSAAEDIVRRIPGVKDVENDITVANEETLSDKDLTDEITRKLAHHRTRGNVGVHVHKGVVTVVGHAGTHDDVQSAVKLIEDIAGVREVRLGGVKVGEDREEDDADVARSAQKILDNLGFDHHQFQVYCDAGVLFVKGFVPTKEDRSRIKTAMHTISGVDKLEATLITDDQVAGEVH